MKTIRNLLGFIALVYFVPAESAKILSVFTLPSLSHYIYGSALLKELASRGHEITSVSTFPQKKPIQNFTDIYIDNNTNVIEKFLKSAEEGEAKTAAGQLKQLIKIFERLCINIYENAEFQGVLKNPKGKFDLIIVEVMWSESLYGLGQHFDVPMIGVSTFGSMLAIDDVVGNPLPNSVIPNPYLFSVLPLSFWDRVQNFFTNLEQSYLLHYKNYNVQKSLYNKYLPNAKLQFEAAIKNFSLLLVNQHHSLSFPRSYVTNVIEAGGLHITRNPDPLPEDLQKWLDNATEGVVYFSMGTNLKSKDFPPKMRNIFLNVFRKLKQKVLWKFEDPNLPDKPDNVLIKSWLPQHSVLNHPNVKVFFTHGGFLSITEAIFFAKPILGMPIFAEQPRNILFAESRGFALSVDFHNLNEKDLERALNELLNNPKYTKKIQTVSSHFHDQPLSPMETAVYWVEYVLRHGGDHLRNAGVDLNIFQYYSLDVVAFIIILFISMLILPIWIVKKVFQYPKRYENPKKD